MRRIVSTIALICIVMCAFTACNMFASKIWEENESKLKEALVREKFGALVLSNFTPFKWDEVYLFPFGTDEQTIYDTIGYKWGEIKHSDTDYEMQVVFVKDSKVVCYCSGTEKEKGYYIKAAFQKGEKYKVVKSKDNLLFYLSTEPGFMMLEYKQPQR